MVPLVLSIGLSVFLQLMILFLFFFFRRSSFLVARFAFFDFLVRWLCFLPVSFCSRLSFVVRVLSRSSRLSSLRSPFVSVFPFLVRGCFALFAIFFPFSFSSLSFLHHILLTGDGHFLKVTPGRTLALGPDIIAIDSIGTTHLRETYRITRDDCKTIGLSLSGEDKTDTGTKRVT